MAGPQIIPEKVTSPFQLMAAWFVMLVLLSSVLLTAASRIEKPDWAAGYLVVFTSILVLLVIGCVTLMLTKFRPHLQDGKEYAQWLKDKGRYSSGIIIKETKPDNKASRFTQKISTRKHQLITNVDISVVNAYDSEEMISALKSNGFNADIYEPEREPYEDHSTQEGIWLGYRVSPEVAARVIHTAVKTWPHLKYVHLSNDGGDPPDYVHDQIFIGGSTSAAIRYGVNEWLPKDFEQLNESMTQKEFHAVVRSKYS
ncbi:hypothetical protein [Saccharophagus degradans]|uniref:Uncharacterized protein n=1 Tax=Saccharophagus degradans TaxID=86304 RepID=A0AAW7X4I8_9GAMM|nr:hypothetical protein [Saccharophagus degradans]MDO6421541.1 hypothetical protein [Saccharophagus degradans]MDO6608645.1 hypothetical protein [Saccharophagus degradans]